MELVVWKGVRGLSTCDVHSLYVLAYCRLAKVPDLIVKEVATWNSLINESFPRLVVKIANGESKEITGAAEIVNYLRENGHGIDTWLTSLQSAEACALETYIVGALAPAAEHLLWIDENNRKALPLILGSNVFGTTIFSNFILPYIRQRHHSRLSHVLMRKLMTEVDLKATIYQSAKECLSNLSIRLSSDSYFGGIQPCYIDALVLSFLLFFKQIPSVDRALANYISQCPNLDSFAKRLSSSLFAIDLNESTSHLSNQALTVSTTQVSEFPHAIRNTILGSLVAISAIALYMVSTGMLKFEFGEDTDIDDDATAKSSPKKKAETTTENED